MKRFIKNINTFKELLCSEQGSALPLIGLGIMTLVGSTGIAIDMGRAQMAQSRMSNALDAAGLAAGANVNSVDIDAEVTKYFYTNFPPGYLDTQVQSLTVTGNADLTVLTLDSSGKVPTTIMKIFGIDDVDISAHTEITRHSTGIELVMVIDTTGSMGGSAGGGTSKINAAKNAANTLLDIVYGDQDTQDNLWVGLVPFSQGVNVGESRAAWTLPDSFDWGTTEWAGCVDAREANNRDVTDDPPLNDGVNPDTRFPKYYWACHRDYNAWFGTNSSRNNCRTSPSSSVRYKSLSTNRGPNKYCTQELQALTASKSTVKAAVQTLSPQGNTHIVLGAAWAWRMLSPRWQGQWGGEMNANNLPLDYDTPLMNKAVVLMTDGDNVISNNVRGAYGYLSDGNLGTTTQWRAEDELDDRLQTVCTNMKNAGIIVYTVAFGTGISGSTRAMMQSCASNPDYYFYSPTGDDLQHSFRQIGDSLANLRISM